MNVIIVIITAASVLYLMFLPAFALLLNLLLFLQLLCDAGLSQRLALAALVGLGIQGGLQSGVTTHAHYHLLTQLWKARVFDSQWEGVTMLLKSKVKVRTISYRQYLSLEVEQSKSFELDCSFGT